MKGQQIATYYIKDGGAFTRDLRKLDVVQKLDDAREIQKWTRFIHI
jgi:hypothetical protein